MAEPVRPGRHAVLPLSGGPEIVPAARRFVEECLTTWRMQPGLSGDAVLLASELVTNALRHGPPPVLLDVSLRDNRVRIAVADSSRAQPRALTPGTWSESGRGLALLEAMAASWGIDDGSPGKWVWCELHGSD